MATVTLTDVRKVFGDSTVAVDDVDLTIEDGDFVVLLGPSGAGKSTLLRILNGLTPPTDGRVEIDGTEVAGSRDDIGMVFQEHYLVENLSAFRNALTGALADNGLARSLLAWQDQTDKRAALEALETVGLLSEADQRAGSMSGGQKQRVGIARALVQDPDLLLADEPVASLDPKAANDVMQYMKDAATERDLTTVVSLHQVNIAREYGDRFVGLRDGTVVFDGDRGDLDMEAVNRIYYGGSTDESSTTTETESSTARPVEAGAAEGVDG